MESPATGKIADTDPYEKIHPNVVPVDEDVRGLIGRHNSAINDAKRMEKYREAWTEGRLPTVSPEEMSGMGEDITEKWK